MLSNPLTDLVCMNSTELVKLVMKANTKGLHDGIFMGFLLGLMVMLILMITMRKPEKKN